MSINNIVKPNSATRAERIRRFIAPEGVVLADGESHRIPTAVYLDAMGLNRDHLYEIWEDFSQAASGTLAAPLTTHDTSSAGSPTLDFVNDAAGGQFNLAHDSQDEQQLIAVYQGDQLTFDIAQGLIFQARFKINFAGAAFTADQRAVVGVAAARNATLDSNATHAWFRVEGASLNLLWETDDGTTDDNDNDTTVDLVDDTFISVRIDARSLSAVTFWTNAEDGTGWIQRGSGDMSDATGNLQIYVEMQKDAGADTDSLVLDYVHCIGLRY